MKIGLIGLGFMGAAHLRAFQQAAEAEVTAICTRHVASFGGTISVATGNLDIPSDPIDLSGMQRTSDWRELVADTQLDAVDICLPTDLHAEIAVAALEAGKHVLCEKPMASTTRDCNRMLAAAEANGRILMIGHVLRFWTEYDILARYVRSSEIGAVRGARFRRSCGVPDWSEWLTAKDRSGGAVLDLLIHDIDQALGLFGMPARVSAYSLGAVDSISATLQYEDGLSVQIEGGWLEKGTPFSMGFEVNFGNSSLSFSERGLSLTSGDQAPSWLEFLRNDAYEAEISYFVSCCGNKTKPEKCPPEESAKAVTLALLLERSRARGGETIACLA